MIIDINNIQISSIKVKSVVITWDSTVPGTSQIEYGTTNSYGSITTEDSLAYFHIHEIIGLSEGTIYHFRIKSKDYNRIETISLDYTFTTKTQIELDNLIKAARLDNELPKIYYVSNSSGNNINNGLSIMNSWKTLSYASSKLDAGDKLYLIEDYWYNDPLDSFTRSGIDVAPILVTNYPGTTPKSEGACTSCTSGAGFNPNGHNYITVENIELYTWYKGVSMGSSNHITVRNLNIHNTISVGIHAGSNGASWNIVENNTLTNILGAGSETPSAIQFSGKTATHPEYAEAMYILVKNNTITNVPTHNGIDLYGWMRYITVDGNTLVNVNQIGIGNPHDSVDYYRYIAIKNNILNNCCGGDSIQLSRTHNSLVYNNTIYKTSSSFSSLTFIASSDTCYIVNNNFIGSSESAIHTGSGYYVIGNIRNTGVFKISGGSSATFINNNMPILFSSGTNNGIFQYDDNSMFTLSLSGSYNIQTPITYSPVRSYMIIQNNFGSTATVNNVIKYPISIIPTIYNASVILNKFDLTLPTGNILIDITINITSSDIVNFNVYTLNPNTNYTIKKNDINFLNIQSNNYGEIIFTDYIVMSNRYTIEYGKTYYVRTDGSDSGSGLLNDSFANNPTNCAWKTITYALANSNIGTGTTIRVQAGTYYNEHAIVTTSGTSISPLIIIGDGNPLLLDTIGSAPAISIDGKQYIEISGITIKDYIDSPGSTSGQGVSVKNSSYINIHGMTFIANRGDGIGFTNVNNSIIQDCRGNNCGNHLIKIGGNYNIVDGITATVDSSYIEPYAMDYVVQISGNSIYNIIKNITAIGNVGGRNFNHVIAVGMIDFSGTLGFVSFDTSPRYNTIQNIYCINANGPVIELRNGANNNTVDGVTVINESNWNGTIQMENNVIDNIIMNFTLINQTQGASINFTPESGGGSHRNFFENGIIILKSSSTKAISIGNTSSQSTFKNITVYGTNQSNTGIAGSGSGTITNCIFSNLNNAISTSNTPVSYSLFYNNLNNGSTTGNGNILNTDPLFADVTNNDFHLKSPYGRWTPTGWSYIDTIVSPAVGKGNPSSDNSKSPWGGVIEMGAYGNTPEASSNTEVIPPCPSPSCNFTITEI